MQTYQLEDDLEALVSSLGGRFVPLEQENARLREKLEDARKEIQRLTAKKGPVKQAALNTLREELTEWKAKYQALQNKSLVESRDLVAQIEMKDAQIDELKHHLATQAKTPRKKKRASAKGPANTLMDDYGIKFVLIEPGTFIMGDERLDLSKPAHKVELTQPFYLGKYPVTQSEWDAITGANPSTIKGVQNPVESVSWKQVQAFLKKLNNGAAQYRLPTEAQWEYACRAGTSTLYSFGDDKADLDAYGWFSSNAGKESHPVGQKKPNPWGLYDMHGNVWEWVHDVYAPYEEGTAIDPAGPRSGLAHAFRGGSYYNFALHLQSAFRGGSPDHPNPHLGFRLLREVE